MTHIVHDILETLAEESTEHILSVSKSFPSGLWQAESHENESEQVESSHDIKVIGSGRMAP